MDHGAAGGGKPADVRLSRNLAFLHVGGIVAAVLVVVATILVISREHNTLAHESSVRLVSSGVEAFGSKMRTVVRDYSIWDEADAAVRAGDIDWLHKNIGTGASEIGALDLIVIVDPNTGQDIGWQAGTGPAGERGLIPEPLLQEVLSELDRLVPRGTLSNSAELATTNVREPEAVSLFAELRGEVWSFAATRIRPLTGLDAGLSDRLVPRQIHGLRVDSSLLRVLEETLLIGDIGLGSAAANVGASVELSGPGGETVAWLNWEPPRPGHSILRRIAAPLGVALFVAVTLSAATSRSLAGHARRLEAALHAARAADRSKTEFLSNVSHELRTPMNGIMGAAQLLEMTELSAEQRQYVDILRTSSRLQLALISDLIDMNQLESGNRGLAEGPFEPHKVASDVVAIVRPTADAKGLRLQVDLTGIEGVAVLGDERALRQILLNLLGNAAKFTRHGSVGLIASSDGRSDHLDLRFRVSDTGPGIPAEHHRAIFTRFYRGDNPSALQAEGTGLGLAISASLAEVMGGSIALKSAPGRGSTFTLRVRLAREELAEVGHASSPRSAAGRRVA